MKHKLSLLLAVLIVLSACTSSQKQRRGGSASFAPFTATSRPYKVKGVWHYPQLHYEYDETGLASWYGPGFHGKHTSTGEVYNMYDLTAAHKTLPLPCIAMVTNLENGRMLKVKVNDRGPFIPGRIIDLSKRAADLLGVSQNGTAKVRVVTLVNESLALAAFDRNRGQIKTSLPQKNKRLMPRATQTLPLQGPPQNYRQVYIQVGAFKNRANASLLVTRLAKIGKAILKQKMIDGKTFYLVRLGPYKKTEEADRALRQLVRQGFREARILVD